MGEGSRDALIFSDSVRDGVDNVLWEMDNENERVSNKHESERDKAVFKDGVIEGDAEKDNDKDAERVREGVTVRN